MKKNLISKTIFLDTNIFLHYKFFIEIDWLKLLEAGKVKIIVPPTVVQELEKHKKDNISKRVRNRAEKIIKKFRDFVDNPVVRDGVNIKFLPFEPKTDFSEYGLYHEIQDDRIIASVIEYKKKNPNEDVILITSDLGLELKVRHHRINFFNLQDEYRLPEELNPDEKKIKRLEKELNELKNTIPSLKILFNDQSDRKIFKVSKPTELQFDLIEKEVEKIKIENSKMEEIKTNKPVVKDGKTTVSDLFSVSPKQISEYNSYLDRYFEDYGKYLEEKVYYDNLLKRTIKLELVLCNEGNAPARGIDIYLYFSNGFELVDYEELQKPPIEPILPRKPLTRFDSFLDLENLINSSFYPNLPLHNISRDLAVLNKNVSSPRIRKTNSYEVYFDVKNLKHTYCVAIDPLYIIFESYDTMSSFHFNYNIIADNMPKANEGTIRVIIEK